MTNIIHWLLPKEQKFFHMLKDQSENAVTGAEEFKRLVDNFNKLSINGKKAAVKKIKDIEHKGDQLAHKIIGILDKTFVTPIDKEDIHRLVLLLDDVIDFIYTVSERLVIFKIGKVDSHIKKLTNVVLECVKKIDKGILGVSKLKSMNQFYIDLHTLENEGDEIYHAALAELFSKKNVIDIIKFKDIYLFLENVIDKCEDVANVIESIVVKHA